VHSGFPPHEPFDPHISQILVLLGLLRNFHPCCYLRKSA
jgi:hypothetical protein